MISLEYFKEIEIRVGTIIEAKLNTKAQIPAYILAIDFGPYGIKTSSAQLTKNYSSSDVIGQQITAVMNFPVLKVAGVTSEVLILAAVCDKNHTILLTTERGIDNGTLIS
jgi:tRNA-binding protein